MEYNGVTMEQSTKEEVLMPSALAEYLSTRNRKFSDKMRKALTQVVEEGMSQKDAAHEAGIMKQQMWMAVHTFKRFEAEVRKNAEEV